MTTTTHTTRKAITILVTAAAAALSAPTALADPPQGHRAESPQPDLVERYVASGRGQTDLVERWVDGRAGQLQRDVIERDVSIRRPVGFPDGRPDGYQPVRAAAPSRTAIDEGFSWSDASIGALAGFALMLLVGGGMLAARRRGRVAHS